MNTATLPFAEKKITLATVKSFIKKHKEELFINVTSSFDGMIDGCSSRHEGFKPVERRRQNGPFVSSSIEENTLGIEGAWFVGDSRDYFKYYNHFGYEGIQVYNSCGQFVLAIKVD